MENKQITLAVVVVQAMRITNAYPHSTYGFSMNSLNVFFEKKPMNIANV